MKKTTYIMMSLAVSVFAAAGCAKQEAGADSQDRLMTIQPEVVSADGALTSNDGGATKATLINGAAGLRTQGFGLSVYNGDTPVYSNLTMQYSNGSWAPESGGPLKWPAGTAYKFYAWSPASLMTEDGSSKFTYSGIADQKDIMLGYYSGTGNTSGNTCSAPIKFSHPLASVQFQVGTMTGLSKINSIKLSGVRPQGTCTVTPATPPIYSWSISNETAVVELSQTKEVSTFTEGTPIGDPFLVLPQPLNTDNITVTLNVTPTSGDAKDISFKITSGIPTIGKTTIYKVNYDGGQGLNFSTPTVTAWGSTGDPVELALEEEEPEYWVDMGFVSKNGKKLLFSTRNVKAIVDDPSTGGKKALWADSDTDPGNTIGSTDIPTTLPATLTSEDGKTCMPLSSTEIIGLLLSDNISSYTLNDSSNPSYYTATSAITGNTVNFPLGTYWSSVLAAIYGYGYDGGYFSRNIIFSSDKIKGSYSGIPQDYDGVVSVDGLFDGQLVRLVCESEEEFEYGETCELYYSLTKHEEWDADNFKYGSFPGKLSKYTSSPHYSDGHPTAYIYLKLPISNGYTMLTEEYLPTTKVNYTFTHNYATEGQPTVGFFCTTWTKKGGSYSIYFKNCNKTYTFSFTSKCFLKGTLITLADGSKKPVEEITYDDILLVWDFDKGEFGAAKPLWLTKSGLHNGHYIKCTFSDSTVLCVTGSNSHHYMYNYTDHKFEGAKNIEVGKKVFTENGVVTLESKEWITEDIEYYSVYTDRHINCFANGVLVSARYNNVYPIDDSMKFIQDERERRPYKEFKEVGISREWYNGFRLGEQPDSLESIQKFINQCESQMAEKPVPSLWQRIKTWWKSIFG